MYKRAAAMTLLSIPLLLAFLGVQFILPVVAITIRVPQDVPTIQMAVNAAFDGDIIEVSAGTYYEHVNITKSITLAGVGGVANTIIDGSGTGYVVYITADNVQVNGLTIQGGERGLYLKGVSGVSINSNVVSNSQYGLYVSYGSSNIISGNTIISNNNYGVRLYYTDSSLIDGNTVSGNYRGISLSHSNGNTVSTNSMSNNNQYGLKLYDSNSTSISGNTASYSNHGIWLDFHSSGNTITSNTVLNNKYGIRLWHSGGNTLRNNAMSGNVYNFWAYGSSLQEYIQDIDVSNTVDAKPVYYWVNQNYLQVPLDAGYVAVVNSTNITVRDLTLTKNYHAILFAYTYNSLIQNVVVSNNVYGIKIYKSNGNTIRGSTITQNNDFGISLFNSNGTTMSGNNVFQNIRYGIHIDSSTGSTLTNNNMNGNKYNFGVESNSLVNFLHTIDPSNTVEGKPVYYWVNQNYLQVPLDAGYVAIINSRSILAKDLVLEKNAHGVLLAYTNSSTVQNVKAVNNVYGIHLFSSTNNTLLNNNMTSNSHNFGVYGTTLQNFIHNIDTSNTVGGKPVYYWINQHYKYVPSDAGYVAIVNSTNIAVKDLVLRSNYQGILLAYVRNTNVNNVTFSNNRFGVYVDFSSGITLTSNKVVNNTYRGVYMYNSSGNRISLNQIVSNTEVGVKIHWQSANNIVSGNTVSNNDLGMWFDFASSNRIYFNNFINNTNQAYQDSSSSNTWDNGYGKGNYWDNYNGQDTNGDRVGDTLLPHEGVDQYPLMGSWAALLGDINGDGKVDGKDIAIAAKAFGTRPGDPFWDVRADVNGDGRVDGKDIAIIAKNFGARM